MIDEGFGEAIVLSTKNVVLKTAWTEYVEQFNGYGLAQWKDLAYWKARLAAAHGGKAPLSRSQKERAQPERRKRKVNPVFKYPGYRAEAVDDDGGGIFLPRRDSGAPNIKQEPHEPASSAEMDAWYDDDDDPHYRMKSSKRSKLDTRGRVSPRPTPPLRTESRSGFSTPTPFPAGPSSLLQRKKRNE